MGRHVFDFGIPGHHAKGAILGNGSSPGRKHVPTKHSFRQGNRAAFQPTHRFALSREIGQQRDYLIRRVDTAALGTLDNGLCDARLQIRILRVAFFIAPHPWITVEFENQR